MLNILAIADLVFLAGFATLHLIVAALFRRYLVASKPLALSPAYAPRVVVVLCLRGPDPFLRQTLLSLLKQDYPNYSVKVVVDSTNDPSWQTAAEVRELSTDVTIEIQELRHRLATCGLKCSSIVQAVNSMTDQDEVLALIDADVVPHRTWLSELIAPLSNTDIGVSTGSQWFEPRHANIGSLIRNVWHTGAIIPTVLFGHPWAGSCAMRLADVRRTGLLDQWKIAIVDDGPIAGIFRSHGLGVHVVPSLVSVNRERCSVAFSFRYIRRMLTWSRLYENSFLLTPLYLFSMAISTLLAFTLIFLGAETGDWAIVAFAGIGIAMISAALLTLYLSVRGAIAKVSRRRPDALPRASATRVMSLAALFPVTIAVCIVAALSALFARRITWRQATYQIDGRWDVKLIEDRPYPSGAVATAHDGSSV